MIMNIFKKLNFDFYSFQKSKVQFSGLPQRTAW